MSSSFSFREDENWLPICLPKFNNSGFLYAHISFVAPELCLVLLVTKADGFAAASQARQQIAANIEHGELRQPLLSCLSAPHYPIEGLGVHEVRAPCPLVA